MSKSPAWDSKRFRTRVADILRKSGVCDDEQVVSAFIDEAAASAGYGLGKLSQGASQNTEKEDARLLASIHKALNDLIVASKNLGGIGVLAVLGHVPSRSNFWRTAPDHERAILAAIDFKQTGELEAARDLIASAIDQLDPTGRGAGRSPSTRAKRKWLHAAAFPVLRLAEDMFGQRATTTRGGWADLLISEFLTAWEWPRNSQRLIQRYQRGQRLNLKFADFNSGAAGLLGGSGYSTGPVTRNPAPIPDLE